MGVKQEVWLGWLGVTFTAAVVGTFAVVTYVHAEFETKEHAKERLDGLDKRLERIESKLDLIGGFSTNRVPAGKGN